MGCKVIGSEDAARREAMQLTKETAKDFVVDHMVELGYEDVVIIRAHEGRMDETAYVDVEFTYRTMDGLTSSMQLFTVWKEDGKLRGEW